MGKDSIFKGKVLTFIGDFGESRPKEKIKNWVVHGGGHFRSKVSSDTTHLIVSERAWGRQDAPVKEALAGSSKMHIVTWDWIEDSLGKGRKQSEKTYSWTKIEEKAQKKRKQKEKLQLREQKELAKHNSTPNQPIMQALHGHTEAYSKNENPTRKTVPLSKKQTAIAEANKAFRERSKAAKRDVHLDDAHVYRDSTGFLYQVKLTKVEVASTNNQLVVISLFESNVLPHTYLPLLQLSGTKIEPSSIKLTPPGCNFATAMRHFKTAFQTSTGVPWDARYETFTPRQAGVPRLHKTQAESTYSQDRQREWSTMRERKIAFNEAKYSWRPPYLNEPLGELPPGHYLGPMLPDDSQLLEEEVPLDVIAAANDALSRSHQDRAGDATAGVEAASSITATGDDVSDEGPSGGPMAVNSNVATANSMPDQDHSDETMAGVEATNSATTEALGKEQSDETIAGDEFTSSTATEKSDKDHADEATGGVEAVSSTATEVSDKDQTDEPMTGVEAMRSTAIDTEASDQAHSAETISGAENTSSAVSKASEEEQSDGPTAGVETISSAATEASGKDSPDELMADAEAEAKGSNVTSAYNTSDEDYNGTPGIEGQLDSTADDDDVLEGAITQAGDSKVENIFGEGALSNSALDDLFDSQLEEDNAEVALSNLENFDFGMFGIDDANMLDLETAFAEPMPLQFKAGSEDAAVQDVTGAIRQDAEIDSKVSHATRADVAEAAAVNDLTGSTDQESGVDFEVRDAKGRGVAGDPAVGALAGATIPEAGTASEVGNATGADVAMWGSDANIAPTSRPLPFQEDID